MKTLLHHAKLLLPTVLALSASSADVNHVDIADAAHDLAKRDPHPDPRGGRGGGGSRSFGSSFRSSSGRSVGSRIRSSVSRAPKFRRRKRFKAPIGTGLLDSDSDDSDWEDQMGWDNGWESDSDDSDWEYVSTWYDDNDDYGGNAGDRTSVGWTWVAVAATAVASLLV